MCVMADLKGPSFKKGGRITKASLTEGGSH